MEQDKKSGAIKDYDKKLISLSAKKALVSIKELEVKLTEEGKLNTFKLKNAYIQSTFIEDTSPMVNYIKNPTIKIVLE